MSGYSWAGETLTDVTRQNMSAYVANGNMITTPLDLAIWVKKLLTGQAGLWGETVDMMKAGSPSSGGGTYGLGIKYYGDRGYGHDGDHDGYITFAFYKPEQDTAYVVVMNVWDQSDYPNSLVAQHDFITTTANKIFSRMGY